MRLMFEFGLWEGVEGKMANIIWLQVHRKYRGCTDLKGIFQIFIFLNFNKEEEKNVVKKSINIFY